MSEKVSRRRFVVASGAMAGAVAAGPLESAEGPTMLVPKTVKPVVVASANGHKYRNGGPRTAVEEAFARMQAGEDVLDALVAGVSIVELDPEDDSVGYGGLPNALGVVQLDSCCMHGPKRRAGGVAAIEGVRTPSHVARAVMNETDHHLLVGHGAREFARGLGFKIEDDLNTEHSRKLWMEWRRRTDPDHYPTPEMREEASRKVSQQMMREGLIDPQHFYGTINCNGITAQGELAGVTTTSGLSWKIPGRVGDSPILGAGLWVDGEVGAAGSTGRGEANLYNLSSHLIVEQMRQGRSPKDAALEALRRIKDNTREKRLLTAGGNPRFNVKFYVVNRKGEHAGVSLYAGAKQQYAVCTENGPEIRACDALLGEPEPGAID